MGKDIVLLTGATGHIGFRILHDLLALPGQPYIVRIAVRSQSKADSIQSQPAIRELTSSGNSLQVAIIPDLVQEGAYTEAIRDVTYVIHVASPTPLLEEDVPAAELKEFFARPAVRGTLELLEAAANDSAQKVRRIVITSSMGAIEPLENLRNKEAPSGTLDERSRAPDSPQQPQNAFEAYGMSKVAALNAAERWLGENKSRLNYSVIHVLPSYVISAKDTAKTPEEAGSGSNWFFVAALTSLDYPLKIPNMVVALEDISYLHIAALDEAKLSLPKGTYQNLLGSTSFRKNETPFSIAQKHFPDATKPGDDGRPALFVDTGFLSMYDFPVDTTETQRLTRIDFTSAEDAVKNLFQHYINLSATKSA